MLTASALAFALTAVSDVEVIAPEQAKEHVGQDLVVMGRVTQLGMSVEDGHALLLNFGGRYPFHVFNAVVLGSNIESFPDARSWEGKVIRVRGKIQLYKGTGKPEIILERPEQVTIESGTTLPQGTEPGGVVRGEGVACDVARETRGRMPSGTGADAVTDEDSPPKVIKMARPRYPQDAFVKKIEGTVLIEALIDPQGRVARALVIHSVPLLDNAALQACCQWVFQPAMKHGRPVATIIHMPVSFRINTAGPAEQEQRKQRPAYTSK